MPEVDSFKLRRGTSEEWAAKNPILREGEPGFEKDTGKFKIGNGRHAWLELDYFIPGSPIQYGGGITAEQMQAHVDSVAPHPAYDDGPSLLLLYENAKV